MTQQKKLFIDCKLTWMLPMFRKRLPYIESRRTQQVRRDVFLNLVSPSPFFKGKGSFQFVRRDTELLHYILEPRATS